MEAIKVNKDAVGRHITELSEEEREKVLGDDKEARASYERCMREGLYNCKRDRCKEAREAKEKEKMEEAERMKTLQERNIILEQQARQQEKAFNDYKSLTDSRIEKLAFLVAQLMAK